MCEKEAGRERERERERERKNEGNERQREREREREQRESERERERGEREGGREGGSEKDSLEVLSARGLKVLCALQKKWPTSCPASYKELNLNCLRLRRLHHHGGLAFRLEDLPHRLHQMTGNCLQSLQESMSKFRPCFGVSVSFAFMACAINA